jgi:CarD family transcriptional regulator
MGDRWIGIVSSEEESVQYSVGDKVVHPYHGPGLVIGAEKKEFVEEAQRYYVIEIPAKELTVYVPVQRVDDSGLRPAISRGSFPGILEELGSKPRNLPEDYRERQEGIWERLRAAGPLQLAAIVRDLLWHKHLEHLTKKDTEYLDRGRHLLAAEMALVSGGDVTDMEKTIESAVAGAVEEQTRQDQYERRHARVTQLEMVTNT